MRAEPFVVATILFHASRAFAAEPMAPSDIQATFFNGQPFTAATLSGGPAPDTGVRVSTMDTSPQAATPPQPGDHSTILPQAAPAELTAPKRRPVSLPRQKSLLGTTS